MNETESKCECRSSPTWKIPYILVAILCRLRNGTRGKFEDMSAQKFVVKRTYQLSLDVIIEQSKCTWCLA